MSEIFAGPLQRGALFRFVASQKSAASPICTSVNLQDFFFAGSLRNLPLATYLNATSCAIRRSFHCCANRPGSEVS